MQKCNYGTEYRIIHMGSFTFSIADENMQLFLALSIWEVSNILVIYCQHQKLTLILNLPFSERKEDVEGGGFKCFGFNS